MPSTGGPGIKGAGKPLGQRDRPLLSLANLMVNAPTGPQPSSHRSCALNYLKAAITVLVVYPMTSRAFDLFSTLLPSEFPTVAEVGHPHQPSAVEFALGCEWPVVDAKKADGHRKRFQLVGGPRAGETAPAGSLHSCGRMTISRMSPPHPTSTASEPYRTRGHNKAVRRPDSERLRANAHCRPWVLP